MWLSDFAILVYYVQNSKSRKEKIEYCNDLEINIFCIHDISYPLTLVFIALICKYNRYLIDDEITMILNELQRVERVTTITKSMVITFT